MVYQSKSSSQTKRIARKLAQKYQGGIVLALTGALGAGKTTFVQGFAEGLGLQQKIISPTFLLARQYPLPNQRAANFYHIDLYRLDYSLKQIESLGLGEIFSNPQNIAIIEWAEKLGESLPKNAARINIEITSPRERKITVI